MSRIFLPNCKIRIFATSIYLLLLIIYLFYYLLIIIYLFIISDLEQAYGSNFPDYLLPVAETKITQCSTFVVVCRLKSYMFTVTSEFTRFSLPDYPLVKVIIPKNAIHATENLQVTVKVREGFLMNYSVVKNFQLASSVAGISPTTCSCLSGTKNENFLRKAVATKQTMTEAIPMNRFSSVAI